MKASLQPNIKNLMLVECFAHRAPTILAPAHQTIGIVARYIGPITRIFATNRIYTAHNLKQIQLDCGTRSNCHLPNTTVKSKAQMKSRHISTNAH